MTIGKRSSDLKLQSSNTSSITLKITQWHPAACSRQPLNGRLRRTRYVAVVLEVTSAAFTDSRCSQTTGSGHNAETIAPVQPVDIASDERSHRRSPACLAALAYRAPPHQNRRREKAVIHEPGMTEVLIDVVTGGPPEDQDTMFRDTIALKVPASHTFDQIWKLAEISYRAPSMDVNTMKERDDANLRILSPDG